MRRLLKFSGTFAAVAFAVPPLFLIGEYHFAEFVMAACFDLLAGLLCLAFLVTGLVQFKQKGLWLVLPFAAAIFWPVYLYVAMQQGL